VDFAETLISLTDNPILGLFIGVLVTVLIQSSSATTSIVVGFVASGRGCAAAFGGISASHRARFRFSCQGI
jgi:Na+/phosphate symporter